MKCMGFLYRSCCEFFSGLDKTARRENLGFQVLLLGTCQKKGGNEVVSCFFSVRSTMTYKWRWTFLATPWRMRCCSSTWPPSSRPATSAHGPPWCVQHPYSASRANRGSSLFLSFTTRLLSLWFMAQPGPAMHMFAGFQTSFLFEPYCKRVICLGSTSQFNFIGHCTWSNLCM